MLQKVKQSLTDGARIIILIIIFSFIWFSPGKILEQETDPLRKNFVVDSNATKYTKQCLKRLETDLGKSISGDFTQPLSFVLKDVLALYLRSTQLTGYNFDHYNPKLIEDASHLAPLISRSGIAVLAISNGVTPNIQEWVVNYLLIGVQHIILIDDSKFPQKANFVSALQPFVEIGYVSFYEPNLNRSSFTGENSFIDRQTKSYQLAYEEFRSNFSWIAIFDTDEYLVLKKPLVNLSSFLDNHSNAGSVYIFWKLILPWGVPEHNISKTHFEQYPYTQAIFESGESQLHHNFGKSIHNTKFCVLPDIHGCQYSNGTTALKVRNNPLELRHHYCGDLKFCLLEKFCGPSELNEKWYFNRMKQFTTMLRQNITSSYDGNETGQAELRRQLYAYKQKSFEIKPTFSPAAPPKT
jgi:hypothetical protein